MICTVLSTSADLSRCADTCRYIRKHLTRQGSDFHKKLTLLASGVVDHRRDGHIAIVRDQGEIVGWCRTEEWEDPSCDYDWKTLEAFVLPEYRDRGVAAWAAAGLVAGPLQDREPVAVFRPSMMMLARRVGLRCTLFRNDCERGWVRA